MRKYCVFWLPRIFHGETILKPALTGSPISFKISDNVTFHSAHDAEIEFLPIDDSYRRFDIRVTSFGPDGRDVDVPDKAAELLLHWGGASRNGLTKFWYDTADDVPPGEEAFIRKALPRAIYHEIKSHFHRHEYHKSDSDSVLEAYMSDVDVDIKSPDNAALLHYLNIYAQKFSRYNEYALEKVTHIEGLEHQPEGYYAAFIDKHRNLERFCRNALGEAQYYRALVDSWYNVGCNRLSLSRIACGRIRLNRHSRERLKELRRTAMNTERAIAGIRFVKRRNDMMYSYKVGAYTGEMLKRLRVMSEQGDRIARRSLWVTVVSFALGIISFLLGVWSVYLSLNP